MVKEWKKQKVKEIEKTIQQYKTIGIVDLDLLPSKQLQQLRKKLRNQIKLIITKKTIIKKALENTKHSKLYEQQNARIPALLLTNMNPFKLYKTLKQNQQDAYAKPGQTTPTNIEIKAGPTEFPPGPMIGEFGILGIKTKIENGKITITKNKTILKQGETITPQIASLLQKLGIKPFKIGLNLTIAEEENTIYDKEVLDVNEEQYYNNIQLATQQATNLSINTGILTKETIPLIITITVKQAKNLAIEATIYEKDIINEIIIKAHSQAQQIKKMVER